MESQENDKNVTEISRFVVVANIVPSSSQKTIKIIDLDGKLLGIALKDEILAPFAGKLSHVNVVLYRSHQP